MIGFSKVKWNRAKRPLGGPITVLKISPALKVMRFLGCFKQPNINKASEDCQPPRILVWGRAERNVAGNKGRAGVLWDIRGAKALDTGGLVHGLVITVT